MEFWRFQSADGLALVDGSYDPWLVGVSWLIASLAGYTALTVKDLLAEDETPTRRLWLAIGSIAMGIGIWSMHFTGMLAFSMPMHMSYDLTITAISAVPAVLGSGWALNILARSTVSFWRLQFGGLILAVAIGTMHYTGMEAMTMEGTEMGYHPGLFALSIVVAFVLAFIALYAKFAVSGERLATRMAVAGLMGLAVAGMHYTAMSASFFYAADVSLPHAGSHDPHEVLSVLVGIVSVLLLSFVLIAATLDRRLRENVANQGRLAQVLPDGLIVVDAGHRILSANPAALRMFAMDLPALINQPLEAILPGCQGDKFLEMASAAETIVEGYRADGRRILVDANSVPQAVNGEATFVIVLRDVTRKREREETLRRLAAAVDNARDAVLILDEHQQTLYGNPALWKLLAREPDQQPVNLGFSLADEAVQTGLANDQHWNGRCEAVNAAGTELRLDLTVSPIRIDSTAPGAVEYIVIARDMADQDRLETQLRHAQKLESIGQLASGIAHEINTPCQYVSDNVAFLGNAWTDLQDLFTATAKLKDDHQEVADAWFSADMDYLQDEVPQAIDQSKVGLEQIKRIVLAMKAFAHPGQDDKEPCDLNDLIENTVTIATTEWKYDAEMHFEFAALPPVPCIQSGLNQVFLNMIVNAAHAIQDKRAGSGDLGNISITTKEVDGGVEVRISDDGAGMPEDVRRRIFDPFYTTKDVGRGSGQGLAIAHNVVVEGHQGSIEVESTPGVGTTFIIRLPLAVRIDSDEKSAA